MISSQITEKLPHQTPLGILKRLESLESTDLLLNGPKEIYFEVQGKLERVSGQEFEFSSLDHYREFALGLLSACGRSWDAKYPFCDGSLAERSYRVHLAFPPISDPIRISIRRLPKATQKRLNFSANSDPDSHDIYRFLLDRFREGQSLLVCGSTGSGKTTFLNELLSELDPAERILTLEDTAELAPRHEHWVSMVAREANADGYGEVTLRQLLKQSLRMRPDRLILGECRGGEVLDLLQALNTGHQGSAATLHANSPREALKRLELLCLLHPASSQSGSLPVRVIRELIAYGLQWIVHLERLPSGKRIIRSVGRIEALEGERILMRSVYEVKL